MIEELVDKLEKLIKNPQLIEKMGKKSKEKFANNYTLEIFEKNMINILNNFFLDQS